MFFFLYLSNQEEILYSGGDEALDQVSQRRCGCRIPGGVEDKAEKGFKQHGLMGGIPA